jgi:hypothetical protein
VLGFVALNGDHHLQSKFADKAEKPLSLRDRSELARHATAEHAWLAVRPTNQPFPRPSPLAAERHSSSHKRTRTHTQVSHPRPRPHYKAMPSHGARHQSVAAHARMLRR